MRMPLDSTRIAHTAFSMGARDLAKDRGIVVSPTFYRSARHTRTSTFLLDSVSKLLQLKFTL